MKILQDVTDLWTMNITFYKEKLNPLSSLMTGATYWCKKQTAIVLVSDRQRNAASQKLSSPMILALYFIHVWTGVPLGRRNHRKAYLIMLITLCLPHPIRDYVIYGQPIKLGKLGTLPNHHQSHLL